MDTTVDDRMMDGSRGPRSEGVHASRDSRIGKVEVRASRDSRIGKVGTRDVVEGYAPAVVDY